MRFPGRHETFAGTEIRALRRQGVEVSVYSLRWRPADADDLLAHWRLDDLPVQWVSPVGYLLGIVMFVRHPVWSAFLLRCIFIDNALRPVHFIKSLVLVPFVLCLFGRLVKAQPDIVHLFWGHYPSLLGLMVKRFTPSIPLSMFLGAYDLNTEYATSHRCAVAADAVFTHARANLGRLEALGVNFEKLHLVYRGIDLSQFEDIASPKTLGRVVSAGFLEEEKGMRHVLEVYRRVKSIVPEASLVIIGDGPDRGYLEQRAREMQLADVEFKGHIPHREVLKELAAAPVFLFLSFSKDDRLPNVVKEAIASRCVCIVSDTPGIEELVEHGRSGYIVAPTDYAAVAETVVGALRDPDGVMEMTEYANTLLESGFDVMATTSCYVSVWETLCQTATAARTGMER